MYKNINDSNIFKTFLIEKLNEYIIKDFDHIRAIKLVIIYKNNWKFTTEQLFDFLKYIKNNKEYCDRENFIEYVYEKLLSHFIDSIRFVKIIEPPILYDNIYFKVVTCLTILDIINSVKNINELLTGEKKINYMLNYVYNDGAEQAYDKLIKSKDIFFAHHKNHSEIIIKGTKICTSDFARYFLHSNIIKYHYADCFPFSILQKIKKICSEVIYDDEFIKKFTETYKDITHNEFCENYHVEIPIDILSNKLFKFKSIKESLPYYNKYSDAICIIKNEDIIKLI